MATEVLYWKRRPCSILIGVVSVRGLSMHQDAPFASEESMSVSLVVGVNPMTELLGTRKSLLSWAYSCQQICNCLRLLKQEMVMAWDLALVRDGKRRLARIAMMAMTTSS